jgi:hypothetical protein
MLKRRDVLRGMGGLTLASQLPGCAGMQMEGAMPDLEPQPSPQMEAFIKTFDSTCHWQKKDPGDKSPFIITYGWGKKHTEQETASGDVIDKSCREILLSRSGTVHENEPTADQKNGIAIAMREMERVANVRFVEYTPGVTTNVQVNHPDKPMLTFESGNFDVVRAGGVSAYPNKDGATIGLSTTDICGNMHEGSFARRTIEHELGHGVGGLKHPSDDSDQNHAILDAKLANQNFAIMSDYPSNNSSVGGAIASRTQDGMVPSTFMTLDIAALQKFLGANWDYNSENKPYILSGKSKIWTVWNGRQKGVFDASAYSGKHSTYINLNSGPVGNPTHIGNEYAWIADRTVIAIAIGAPYVSNRFVGNIHGGSTFIGGEKGDSYELAGKGNQVVAGGGKNIFILHPGAQVTIEGFDCARDTIELANTREASHVLARTAQGDTILRLIAPSGRSQVTLTGFQGEPKNIKLLCTPQGRDILDTTPSKWAKMASLNNDPNNPLACHVR